MFRFYTILIILFQSIPLISQVVLDRSYLPVPGDTLYMSVDNLPEIIHPGSRGENQRWDFTTLKSPFARRIIMRPAKSGQYFEYFPGSEVVTTFIQGAESYYRQGPRGWELLGYVGPDPVGIGIDVNIHHQPALLERPAPLQYRSIYRDSFEHFTPFALEDIPRRFREQLTILPDSFRLEWRMKRSWEVDGWGLLTLPGGIYDVLRQKREWQQEVKLWGKRSRGAWQDITNTIRNGDGFGITTGLSYHFYSDEAREAIAILEMDPYTKEAIRVEFKAEREGNKVLSVNASRPNVYASPNPAMVNVRFEFTNLTPGNYTLRIYNILGVEVWQRQYYIRGDRIDKVNLSDLKKGTYLYSLSNDKGRTITTKRLVITRP